MGTSSVLVIDDERAIADGIELNFRPEGIEVRKAYNGLSGLSSLRDEKPDLVILDLMLPGELNGFDVCRQIRKENERTPILILSAKGEEIDKVLGLELGADDYITKPFSIRELLARVRANLRRSLAAEDVDQAVVHRVGNLEIDLQRHAVSRNGEAVYLTQKEFQILAYLFQHRDKVLSRDQLLDEIWGYDEFITTRTVDNHILHLRKKIEEDPTRPSHIVSVWGEGYMFVG